MNRIWPGTIAAWIAALAAARAEAPAGNKPAAAPPAAPAPAAAQPPADGMPRGEVHRVTCDGEDPLVYFCFLPAAFDPARRYPVVYGFSPKDGEGEAAAKRWAEAAGRAGWVVAWSDRGVPETISPEALKPAWDALTASVEKRLRAHPRRSYAAGYAAGARAAVALARAHAGKFAGVFADGDFEPESGGTHPKHLAVYATCSRAAPKAREIAAARADCRRAGVPFELKAFDARAPEPAPARVIDEGVRWMDREWFVHQDDDSPEARQERLAAAQKVMDEIRGALKKDDRPAAYDRALEFHKTFKNTTDPALEKLVAEAAATIDAAERDPAVAGLVRYAPPAPGRVVEAFLRACDGDPKLDAARREAARRILDAAKGDASRLPDALADAVAALHPAFRKALDAFEGDQPGAAAKLFAPLRQSADLFLAAHAAYFEARALVAEERVEDALPILSKVAGEWIDRTLYAGESLFLVGVCQMELLNRRPALRVLRDFIKHYPDAPERMRVGAEHVVRTLSAIEDGSLADVQDRMDDSRRRLKLASTGEPTRDRQGRIIAMLDKLIKEAEDRQNQGGGGGGGGGGQQPGGSSGGPPSGNQQSNGPANSSSIGPGEARIGALGRAARGNPEEVWGNARQRDREAVLNVLKAKFPERYRELIEQYYKSLQESDK